MVNENPEEFVEEIPDEAAIDEELTAWTDKIKAWLKAHPGKTLKDALIALKGKAEADEEMGEAPTMNAIVYAMKKAGIVEAKIKKAMEILRGKYPSPYPAPEKAEDEALEYVIRQEMLKKAPTMDAIAYAIEKAGGSAAIAKKAMKILREKYPYPYPAPEKEEKLEEPVVEMPAVVPMVEDIEKNKDENKELKEKVEEFQKPLKKSEQSGEKAVELSEDEIYALILKGIRGA